MPKKYDVAIIGSGPGGYAAAIRLRQLNKSVCVIDIGEERLGGVCLNEGCIPVKSLIHSSKLFHAIKNADNCGIEASAKMPDMKKIVASSQATTSQLQGGLSSLFKKYGIEFIAGKAKLISRNEINIESKDNKKNEVEADKIIIVTGSSPKLPLKVKIDGEIILTSNEAIKLKKVPKTLLVVGAGAIGVEFSNLFASLETKVTLAEMMPNILPYEDEEVSKALMRILKKRGIEILVKTKVKGLDKKGRSAEAVLDVDGTEKKMRFDCVLMATGRKPNTEDIGLRDAGVESKNGFIVVDDRMRTNVNSIYAAGDIVNTPMYAHVAYREGVIAAEDIADVKTEPIDYESVPNVVFSEPQIASVGLTESEARKRSDEVIVSKHFFKANGMAVLTHREEGFIKIIADKKTRQILGVHIIGGDATEMLHEFVVAKNSRLKVDDIAKAIHAHPTFSEIAADAAKSLFDKPIHG